jgi:hypothetical protein
MSNTRAQGQVAKAKELIEQIREIDPAQADRIRDDLNAQWKLGQATFEYVSSAIGTMIDFVKQERAAKRGQVSDIEVPEGRYAAKNTDGDWAFYRVTAKGKVYVFRSDETRALPFIVARSVKAKIVEMGLEDSAVTFGRESKFCYVCGHRLTDEVSRDLGIGPKCRAMGV